MLNVTGNSNFKMFPKKIRSKESKVIVTSDALASKHYRNRTRFWHLEPRTSQCLVTVYTTVIAVLSVDRPSLKNSRLLKSH